MDLTENFARAEITRDGGFWIETPQTASVMVALLRAFAVSRMEDSGWQPIWILCGAPGAGRTALASRFAARARMIATGDTRWSSSRDAYEGPADALPEIVRESDSIWSRYRTELDKANDVLRFGVGRSANWRTTYASGSETTAIPGVDDAEPVILKRMNHEIRRGHQTHAYPHGALSNWANKFGDNDPRRTTLAILDDVEHLVRLSEAKRMQALEEMVDWPDVIHLSHRVTLVLIGSPALADAVASCKPVCRIDLHPMEDGPDGTFAKVCSVVFGGNVSDRLPQLYRLSDGLIGRLLHIANLEGLRAPYAWTAASRSL